MNGAGGHLVVHLVSSIRGAYCAYSLSLPLIIGTSNCQWLRNAFSAIAPRALRFTQMAVYTICSRHRSGLLANISNSNQE
ncbi:hypothetical protein BDN71DRAFT_724937 [Pleurotus eryngii]|uniref:Uncharacterized protein n=1 Tax=Pleurotus eryngii TaxID=5323 RepID=A0A9P6ABZ5_PLEER|nr:hypothetical protein BDN71DRAFT_724937 [Pleurotus eryngii]